MATYHVSLQRCDEASTRHKFAHLEEARRFARDNVRAGKADSARVFWGPVREDGTPECEDSVGSIVRPLIRGWRKV